MHKLKEIPHNTERDTHLGTAIADVCKACSLLKATSTSERKEKKRLVLLALC